MIEELNVVVMLNEKEACISFPNNYMESDLGKIFYSTNSDFHEWCFSGFLQGERQQREGSAGYLDKAQRNDG